MNTAYHLSGGQKTVGFDAKKPYIELENSGEINALGAKYGRASSDIIQPHGP